MKSINVRDFDIVHFKDCPYSQLFRYKKAWWVKELSYPILENEISKGVVKGIKLKRWGVVDTSNIDKTAEPAIISQDEFVVTQSTIFTQKTYREKISVLCRL